MSYKYVAIIVVGALILGTASLSIAARELFQEEPYHSGLASVATANEESAVPPALHIPTPSPVKGIYTTSWVAGSKNENGEFARRNALIKFIDDTEINSIVIDIKDATGRISFELEDPVLDPIDAGTKRIPDIREFIEELHKHNIYVIGRVSVFQDPYLVSKRPDLAILSAKTGTPWKDRKGISWLDAGAKDVWKYVVAIAKRSHEVGFDEINFDYVRFPSDGDISDLKYTFYDPAVLTKPDQIEQFFTYLQQELAGTGIVTSADLFGLTTSAADDMNIGQVLERALPHFDYVAPMVYPSHFPPHFNGYANPNTVPYEIVKFSMDKAIEKANNASSSPQKLRPWLQDFDYGGDYDETKVRDQKRAVYDAGLTSWLMWDPSVVYTKEAYDKVEKGSTSAQ